MTTRSLTLNHHTRLAIQIIIEDDTGVLAFSTQWTTKLFTLFWHINRWTSFVSFKLTELNRAIADLLDAIGMATSIYLAALEIVTKSFAFGVGMRL
jgi:hypothetical protein